MDDQSHAETLADWGEFRLINELVLPLLKDVLGDSPLSWPVGDDYVYIPIPRDASSLVITSDAAPRPLVWDLCADKAPYNSWGWYSVLVNASDLAAAGAKPLAFTSSIDAPPDMLIEDFRQFFLGVATACRRQIGRAHV